MASVRLRFYAELRDCLPGRQAAGDFSHSFTGQVSIKDMIESLGVPHTEVDLILANGSSVDFSYLVRDGDQVSVYPVFESIDIRPILRVRPRPLRVIRFVLDVHLGKLASYLRLLGFDSLYGHDFEDAVLARFSSAQHRILLTRDRGLLKRSQVSHGYWIRETHPRRQLVEVLRRFDLTSSLDPFSRCLRCNGKIREVAKEEVVSRVHPRTRKYYQKFWLCLRCGRVYWKGSHHRQMQRFLESVITDA